MAAPRDGHRRNQERAPRAERYQLPAYPLLRHLRVAPANLRNKAIELAVRGAEAVPSSRLFPVFAIIRRTTVYGAYNRGIREQAGTGNNLAAAAAPCVPMSRLGLLWAGQDHHREKEPLPATHGCIGRARLAAQA
jgi:hypothetical protein